MRLCLSSPGLSGCWERYGCVLCLRALPVPAMLLCVQDIGQVVAQLCSLSTHILPHLPPQLLSWVHR